MIVLRFNDSQRKIFAGLAVLLCFALHTGGPGISAFAEEIAEVKIIEATEIKDEEDEGIETISLEEVEKQRALTTDRIYSLVALWILILLCIFVIRLQLRDDDKLYQEGYYPKDVH